MTIRAGDQFGQYTIEQSLSESGGTSQIFLAADARNPNLKVVLKIQLSHDNNSTIYQNLINQEVEVLQLLRHPGIVHIYPLEIDGRIRHIARASQLPHQPWYFAMEYLGPHTLAHYIETISTLPLEWGIELFYQLLLIIDYMHQKGYAHCDLKPQNIFLRHPPNRLLPPHPVLADFGSTAQINQGVHQLTASLRYSPPEVLLALERHDMHLTGIHPDKVDIWALGAILFEIVTGRALVNAQKRQIITTTVIRGEFEQMTNRRRDKHPALQSLDRVLGRMINADPEQRPPTEQLIRAIEERIAPLRPPRIPFA